MKNVIEEIKELMANNVYERTKSSDPVFKRFDLSEIYDDFRGYWLSIYGRTFDHDYNEFWLRFAEEDYYAKKTVIIINDETMWNDDIATLIVEAIKMSKEKLT